MKKLIVLLLAMTALGSSMAAQTVVNFDASVAPTSTSSYPFSLSSNVLQTFWTPSQLNNTNGLITEFGLQFSTALSRTWPSVEIRMGESTNTMANFSTTFASNYNAVPAQTVFNGPLSVTTTTTNELWRVPLSTPFNYTGVNQLVVEIRVNGTSTGTGTITHRVQFSQNPGINCRIYNTSSYTATTGSKQDNLGYGASFLVVPPGPSIYTSVTALNLGSAPVGTAGTTQNYTITGYQTTSATIVTAPANVEIKLSTSSTWVSSFSIPNTGNWGPFTVNARISGSAPIGPVSGTITHVSPGLTQRNITVSGTVTPPTIITSTNTRTLGSTPQGVTGTAYSYTVSGSGMQAATIVTPPSGVEISFSQTTGYVSSPSSLNIATTGIWGPTTIWARISSSAPVGPVTGNIVHSSSGAATVNVAVSGTVTPPTISTSTNSLPLGTTTQGTAGTPVSYTVSGSILPNPTVITPPAGVEISFSQTSGYVASPNSLNIATTGTWGPTTIWARISAGAAVGPLSGNIVHSSTGAATVNVAVSGTVNQQPTLMVNTNFLDLGTTALGTAGSILSYTINGTATIAATSIGAPAGVELSFTQLSWSTTLSIPSTGTWPNTTVYVRIAATAPAGPITGNVTNATTGAVTQNVAVSGTVTPPPSLLAMQGTLDLGSTGQGVPGTEFS